MKNTIILKSLITSSLIFSFANAQDDNFFELGFGIDKTNSEFNVPDDNNTSKESTDSTPLVRFNYGYVFNEKVQAYIKSDYGDLNLGATYKFDDSKVDLGLIYALSNEEVWSNPFNKSSNKDKSEVSENGFYLAYSKQINQDLNSTFKYQITKKEYENDQVHSSLKRDGTKHIFSFENEYKSYMLNLHTEIYSADGKASSYKAVELEVGKGFRITNNLSLVTLANIGIIKYDELNPELNKKIDATTYGVKMRAKYDKPFNFENSYVAFTTGHESINANDTFYDEDSTFGFVSVGYKF